MNSRNMLAMLSMYAALGTNDMLTKRDPGPSQYAQGVNVTNPAANETSKRKQKKRQGKQSRAKRKKGKR